MVIAILHAEVELLGRASLLCSPLERLRLQLAVLEELVRRANVNEHVERALGRLAVLEEVRGVVLEPLGWRVRARACV